MTLSLSCRAPVLLSWREGGRERVIGLVRTKAAEGAREEESSRNEHDHQQSYDRGAVYPRDAGH